MKTLRIAAATKTTWSFALFENIRSNSLCDRLVTQTY